MRSFDIETIPDEAMIGQLPEPEVATGAMKDPEKIEAKRMEAKKKQIDKMGLNPFWGRVCSFSFYSNDISFVRTIPEISDAAEIELINELMENLRIGQPEPNEIITWNGYGFDFPYIYKRAAILRIPLPRNCPPLRYWLRKYEHEPHCDLMQELAGWNIENRGSLDSAACRLIGEQKTKRDYSTYVELIKAAKGELIGLDNLCDAELTFKLHERLSPYLF